MPSLPQHRRARRSALEGEVEAWRCSRVVRIALRAHGARPRGRPAALTAADSGLMPGVRAVTGTSRLSSERSAACWPSASARSLAVTALSAASPGATQAIRNLVCAANAPVAVPAASNSPQDLARGAAAAGNSNHPPTSGPALPEGKWWRSPLQEFAGETLPNRAHLCYARATGKHGAEFESSRGISMPERSNRPGHHLPRRRRRHRRRRRAGRRHQAARARRRAGPRCWRGLGGFGALFDSEGAGFNEPILVSGTDGVGTKLKIAIETGRARHASASTWSRCASTTSLVPGAEPLFFLDYFATGKLDVDDRRAGGRAASPTAAARPAARWSAARPPRCPACTPTATTTSPASAVGVVERGQILPRRDDRAGDVLIGLASSGLHSNGYSLVRRSRRGSGLRLGAPAPFDAGSRWPTRC